MYSFYLTARIRIPQIVVCFLFLHFLIVLLAIPALVAVFSMFLFFLLALLLFLSLLSMGLFDRVWIYSLRSRASWLTAAQCAYAFCLCSQWGFSSLYDMSPMVEGVFIAFRTKPPPCGFSRMERGQISSTI